jgi:hypothetical protein
MKQISASIIVLAAAVIMVGGSHFTGDTQTFILAVGCVVCAVGLWGWFVSLKEK